MYRDTPEFMYPAAARSVLAAMENLVRKEQVIVQGDGLTLRERLRSRLNRAMLRSLALSQRSARSAPSSLTVEG